MRVFEARVLEFPYVAGEMLRRDRVRVSPGNRRHEIAAEGRD
jgi:hypothetical protein